MKKSRREVEKEGEKKDERRTRERIANDVGFAEKR